MVAQKARAGSIDPESSYHLNLSPQIFQRRFLYSSSPTVVGGLFVALQRSGLLLNVYRYVRQSLRYGTGLFLYLHFISRSPRAV